eukprot:4301387-Amphidinium_carterae.1
MGGQRSRHATSWRGGVTRATRSTLHKVTIPGNPDSTVWKAQRPCVAGTERSEPCAETVSSQQQAEIDTEREVVDAEQKAEREVAEEREEEMCTVEAHWP